jgi:hypothetical protein
MEKEKKWYIMTPINDHPAVIVNAYREELEGKFSSLSPPYNSKEEIYADKHVLKEPCKICGGIVDIGYREVGYKLKRKNICFDCNFWEGIIEDKDSKIRVFADHVAYRVGVENPNPYFEGFKGFGGRGFKITNLKTGEEIISHNLWCNGDIPELFWDRLPDTHKIETL